MHHLNVLFGKPTTTIQIPRHIPSICHPTNTRSTSNPHLHLSPPTPLYLYVAHPSAHHPLPLGRVSSFVACHPQHYPTNSIMHHQPITTNGPTATPPPGPRSCHRTTTPIPPPPHPTSQPPPSSQPTPTTHCSPSLPGDHASEGSNNPPGNYSYLHRASQI
ncbi:uncharacterized 16 kDa protein in middle repetitive insertion sequence WIS1-like [Asterias rubens]|uniref:uncharacterized 16 kDa protein in middle repetitive insertion sequence WIS1-like n=1 Tax=Asterias rubens TaxID=7604 RepID=UPI0014550F00|nr:uncharacterized 16 kDa protein in middle repetitive insertion sequence WIS1-like [Asterias rubens]